MAMMPLLKSSLEPNLSRQSFQGAELAFLALLLRKGSVEARETDERGDWEDFIKAAGNFFQVSREETEEIRSDGIMPEEVVVVLHLSRSAGVYPADVVEKRLAGAAWRDVMVDFHLGADTLYVPIVAPADLPLGSPYGFYRQTPRSAWNVLRLSDEDVVNLTNLKFLSDYHGFAPDKVVALRSAGWSFAAIHNAASEN